MTTVCVITTSFPRSDEDDSGIFVARLVQALSDEGVGGIVVVPWDGNEPREGELGLFRIHRSRYHLFSKRRLAFGAGIMPNLRARPLLILQVPGLIISLLWTALRHRNRYDLIHANWFGAALAAFAVHLLARKPFLIALRGEDSKLFVHPLLRFLLYPIVRSASFITSVNRSFLEEMYRCYRIPKHLLHTIPNGIDSPELSPESLLAFAARKGLDPAQKRLLFVGTLVPRKRVEVLIELLADPRLHNYVLMLCGRSEPTYLEQLRKKAESLHLLERVRFEGKVSPLDVPYYLRLSRCFLSASEHEGRPNAVLEAFAARVPVILSKIRSHEEIVRNGENGFLFDPEKLEEVPQNILALENSASRSAITDAAYEKIKKYTWKAAAREYVSVFQELS